MATDGDLDQVDYRLILEKFMEFVGIYGGADMLPDRDHRWTFTDAELAALHRIDAEMRGDIRAAVPLADYH